MITVHPLRVRKGGLINYTYLVQHSASRDALLIDPGAEPGVVLNRIYETGSIVRGILLTHYHSDHTALASYFAEAYGVPVYMNAVEQQYYDFHCTHLQPFTAGRPLLLGNLSVWAWHTPGHTKGSTSYQIDDCLFTGDTLFAEGCGMCFDRGGDPVDMYHSLCQLRQQIGAHVKIYPGHSYGKPPGIPFSEVLNENIYFHLADQQAFVAFRMRKHQQGLYNFR